MRNNRANLDRVRACRVSNLGDQGYFCHKKLLFLPHDLRFLGGCLIFRHLNIVIWGYWGNRLT